jgi:hypothetical protein
VTRVVLVLRVELAGNPGEDIAGYGRDVVASLEKSRTTEPIKLVRFDFPAGQLISADVELVTPRCTLCGHRTDEDLIPKVIGGSSREFICRNAAECSRRYANRGWDQAHPERIRVGNWVRPACGHIFRESRPKGFLIDPALPRVCSNLCRPDHPAAVGMSPQGFALMPVTYHDTKAEAEGS